MSDTDTGKTRRTPVSKRCLFFFFRFFDMVPTQHVGEEEGGRERDQRPYGERFERERLRKERKRGRVVSQRMELVAINPWQL